jgi:hypothetical protein
MSGTKTSKWRSESILDSYNLSFAVFLFVSPWLFSYAQENARIGILISSAVTAISAILAYANWKEWLFCLEPG